MISDAQLIAQVNGEDEDLPRLRALEQSAIKHIENRTGNYFGREAQVTEFLLWRGWPMLLGSHPIDGIVTLESFSNGTWNAVDVSSYSLHGGFIYWEGVQNALTRPTRYRATYNAGFGSTGGTYGTGYGTDEDEWNAPEDVKQAVLLLVAHWFRNREGEYPDDIERALKSLLEPHTRVAV